MQQALGSWFRPTKFLSSLKLVERNNEREATKGAWWMPRLSEMTKDVVSCEKLRGAANEL